MTFIVFLCRSTMLLAVLAASSESAEPVNYRPNIVLILIDDLGWSDLSCYGHRFHETPAIDRLAREGIRFTSFYAATPVCSSTRSTIQTGQYSARTGITDFIPGHWRPFEKLIVPPIEHRLKDNIKTIGDALVSNGYSTGYFGKWHLGNEFDNLPARHGYQVTDASLGRKFKKWRGDRPDGPKSMNYLTDATLWFIDQHKRGPFFVTLSHHAVHIPVEATPRTTKKYQQKTRPEQGVNHPGYAAMIEDLDNSINRILNRLEELGLDKNTIVVVTSDNGGLRQIYTGMGEVITTNAPLRAEKGTLYEGGIRVPMIVRWPHVVRPSAVCDQLATTADLMPTFCEMSSSDLPDQVIDGMNIVPMLKNPKTRFARDTIYFHYPHYHHSRPAGAIRQGDWKLIEYFDDGSTELYNLADDLGESRNLANHESDLARQMQTRLAAWRHDVGASMPTVNPEHDADKAHQWWSRRTGKPLDIEAMRRRYETQRAGK